MFFMKKKRHEEKIPEWTFLAMCCNTFWAFFTLLEKGHLETSTLVYDKNARVSKPLSYINGQQLIWTRSLENPINIPHSPIRGSENTVFSPSTKSFLSETDSSKIIIKSFSS